MINFCIYCQPSNLQKANKVMGLDSSPAVEGVIKDVIDSPFGIMLTILSLWKIEDDKVVRTANKNVTKVKSDIKEMFVPMTEISRIDFL